MWSDMISGVISGVTSAVTSDVTSCNIRYQFLHDIGCDIGYTSGIVGCAIRYCFLGGMCTQNFCCVFQL